MKNTKFLAVILAAFILASCGTSHDVVDGGLFQKRKYNKGYHISKKSKTVNKKGQSDGEVASASSIEKVELKTASIEVEPITSDQTVITESSEIIAANMESEKNEVITAQKPKVQSTFATKAPFKKDRNLDRGGSNLINQSTPVSFEKKHNTSDSKETTDNTLLLVIIAFFIPFLAVGLYDGISGRFWLSLILTLLFWLPGFIYALIVILE